MDNGHTLRAAPHAAHSPTDAACATAVPRQSPQTPEPIGFAAEPAGRADTPGELEYASWLQVLRHQPA